MEVVNDSLTASFKRKPCRATAKALFEHARQLAAEDKIAASTLLHVFETVKPLLFHEFIYAD